MNTSNMLHECAFYIALYCNPYATRSLVLILLTTNAIFNIYIDTSTLSKLWTSKTTCFKEWNQL